jgi:hypothetical protein
LTLVNPGGAVSITGGGGEDVRIEAVKRVWDRSDSAARAGLDDVRIEVAERDGGVDVRATVRRPRSRDAEVDFTIAVPAGAAVSVRSGSGDIVVTGVRGEVRAEAIGGSIKASALGEVRLLRTLSGAIALERAESRDVTVSTLGGPLTIRQLKARVADLRTVGGDVIVTDSEAERLTAQALSGRVELTGRLTPGGRYSLRSQSGAVQLTPVGSTDFEVEAATVTGTVQSELPITIDDRRALSGAGERQRVRSGRIGTARAPRGGARILRGRSGNGGPLVTLRSFSGDIVIARR